MGKIYRLLALWIFFFVSFNAINATDFLVSDDVSNKKEKASVTRYLQQRKVIKGIVKDETGIPLPGVTITIVGSTKGVITDIDGNYSIDVNEGDQLLFSFVGLESQTIKVEDKSIINVTLEEKIDELEEVTIVAFAKQKKESVISSIQTVKPSDLKVPSSNLTTALAGRMSGLISYQRSGEPGVDDASFFVRGVTSFSYAKSPLILIDGVEVASSDLSRLQPDDIASFSIMKDAAATALYGARGGNGVILVTTKEGKEGKAKMSVRYETSFSMPTKKIEMSDPITYMRLNNEAITTRDPLTPIIYSESKIENTKRGVNPLIYPATDWHDELFNDYAVNHRVNFNLSGGGKVSRYYMSGTYNQDNGILKVSGLNNFNNNIDLRRYDLRSNINIDVTPTTEVIVRLNGTFDDYTGPLDSGSSLYRKVMRTDPVLFPPYYPYTESTANIQHILFGNYDIGQYINPYADMVKGYREYTRSQMFAQFELIQNLDLITEGLNVRGLFNTKRYSYFHVNRFYNPFYYVPTNYNKNDGSYQLTNINPTQGTEYLNYNEGAKEINTTTYGELAVNYNKAFFDHEISGMLVATLRNYLEANAGSLQLSLPGRNIGLAGRFTYSYDQKYFTEFNFGYNGSERFSQKERWGFFPSIGLGWIVSNEIFWGTSINKIITNLKLKGTYGLSGNDAIGTADDRFFYLSEVNMNSSSKSFSFGEDFGYSLNGVSISRYSNDKITWETAKKLNLGLEVGLFNSFDLMLDIYHEYRKNILMTRASIPTTMGLQSSQKSNIGEASGSGFDLSLDYNKVINKNLWITGRLNFTYATSRYEAYEDVDNSETPWLNRIGQPVNQQWGYIAERLFVDENEIKNSPTQTFSGDYMGGDIKYRDINNDGLITSLDMVPIGYPTIPEIIYGFGLSAGYKGFDASFFFQGLARESFWINPTATAPFVDVDGNASIISKNVLLKVYEESYWSESNRDLYALWPRLSNKIIENNTQRSTWFMREGGFLRLKSVEIGYSLPQLLSKKYGIDNLRIYLSGVNLLTFSKFKLWDPEMAGDGLGYPIQKVYNIGLQVTF